MLLALWPAHWSRTQRSNATLVAALVLMALVLSLLGQLLSFFPEPIGSNAALFADGALTTLYLTLVSGAVGLVLAWLGLWAVRQQPASYAELAHLDPMMLLATVVLALGASLLAGLIPAWQAMQVTPARQLKSQ